MLTINIEDKDDFSCVILNGELDLHVAHDLREKFLTILDKNINKIIVDFTSVNYIDSSGLATLVELFQRLKKENGTLKLFGLKPQVKDVFELSRLEKVFDMYPDMSEALGS